MSCALNNTNTSPWLKAWPHSSQLSVFSSARPAAAAVAVAAAVAAAAAVAVAAAAAAAVAAAVADAVDADDGAGVAAQMLQLRAAFACS